MSCSVSLYRPLRFSEIDSTSVDYRLIPKFKSFTCGVCVCVCSACIVFVWVSSGVLPLSHTGRDGNSSVCGLSLLHAYCINHAWHSKFPTTAHNTLCIAGWLDSIASLKPDQTQIWSGLWTPCWSHRAFSGPFMWRRVTPQYCTLCAVQIQTRPGFISSC